MLKKAQALIGHRSGPHDSPLGCAPDILVSFFFMFTLISFGYQPKAKQFRFIYVSKHHAQSNENQIQVHQTNIGSLES